MSGPEYEMDVKPGAVRGHTYEVFRLDAGGRVRVGGGGSGSTTREEAETQAKGIARADRTQFERQEAGSETVSLDLD
jgi:hypothetical protein